MFLFKLGLSSFLLLGVALVLIQIVGVLLPSPALVTAASRWLTAPCVAIAAGTGLLSFVMAYLPGRCAS